MNKKQNIFLSNSRIIKDLFNVALPFSVSTIIGVVVDLICLRIVGGFNVSNYYILALFVPISFFVLSIFECYRAPTLAFSSRMEAQKQEGLIGNYIIVICILSFLTMLSGLILFFIFSKWIISILFINVKYAKIFIIFTLLMLGFSSIRSCSYSLLGVLYGIGKQKLAMCITSLSALGVLALTYVLSFYINCAVYAYAYSLLICTCIVFVVRRLIKRGLFREANINFIKKQFFVIARSVYQIGMPIFVSYTVIFSGLFFFNAILAHFGHSVVAGFGVGYRIQSLVILPAISIGIATGILINKNIAVGLQEKADHILKVSLVTTFIIYMFISFAIFLLRDTLVHLIVQEHQVFSWAVKYLYCIALTYPAFAITLVFLVVLEQIGLGIKSVMLNLFYFSTILLIGWLVVFQSDNATLMFEAMAALNIISFIFIVVRCFGFNKSVLGSKRCFMEKNINVN